MSECLARLARRLPEIVGDLAGLAGAAMIAYGAWMISPPMGWITGGVLLVTGALLAARRRDA